MAPSTCCNISITKLGNIRDLRLYVAASPERLLERPKLSNPIFSDYLPITTFYTNWDL